jgi:hypothetical protein
MKKIALIVSAISAALFASATAKADVSVSGAGALGVVSGDSTNGTRVYNGASMSFGLSSDLGNGVTVSTSAGISLDNNDAKTLGTVAATGLSNLTFATGGATIVVGGDVDIAGDGVGELGGVAGDLVDEGGYNTSPIGTGLTQEDGYGVSLSTAMGGATVTASYILDSDGGNNYAKTDDTGTATGVQVSLPLGALSATVGFGTNDVNSESVVGGEVAYSMAGVGTLKAGMAEKTGNTDNSKWGIEYSGSLGGASLSVGYMSASQGSSESTQTEASISQSIGAGASVYLDIQTGSGSGTSDAGTNIAVGTSFSF